MIEPKFLSIICTRGIMVSSLGFETKLLGSNPNSEYLIVSPFLSIDISQNTNFITLKI